MFGVGDFIDLGLLDLLKKGEPTTKQHGLLTFHAYTYTQHDPKHAYMAQVGRHVMRYGYMVHGYPSKIIGSMPRLISFVFRLGQTY